MNAIVTSQESALLWTEALARDLLVFLTGRVKCPDTAADLTHETYLRFHRSTAAAPPDNARALAFQIAVNLAIDYQRHCKVKAQVISEVEEGELEAFADQSIVDPLRVLISRERFEQMEHALCELSAECRTAFILHKLQHLSYAEIARRMGVSERSVGRLLEQAILHSLTRMRD